ncbi:winged helix DNA-binding protein [Leisingera sp. S132]|uniref:winged helix DNA-binding protein n=1 Tax=Leisingera sp. S132 TaxID=2867016 RepID=UPI0021A410AE|nr:winged helix DNA-binding protein [Leisingera sp. S132]UWQ78716.1 winged helix DNA-binding protein [Leisingera sp. S132]
MNHSVSQSLLLNPIDHQSSCRLRDLEIAVQRTHEGLVRWQVDRFEQLSGIPLSGAEVTLLLLIAEGGRAISIKEMARITNRVDIPNIQYSLRKLASAGLTRKQGAGRSGVSYSLTEKGSRTAAEMQAAREDLLEEAFAGHPSKLVQLQGALAALEELTALYGSAEGSAGPASQD